MHSLTAVIECDPADSPACLDPVCNCLVRSYELLGRVSSFLSVAVFPILINTLYRVSGACRKLSFEAGRMLGCTKSASLIRHIAFPAALPSVVAGIRIATGVGWMCLVAAELFGVSKFGLGQKLWHYYNLHQMDNVVVYMLLLGIIGLLFDMIFRYYVDRRFLRWRTREVI
jgi:NitT/TauT family transport system permease protein